MTPQALGHALYSVETLIYGAAERLEFFAGRDHPLLRLLHHYTDPAVGAEYWRLFAPPETSGTAGIAQPIEAHIAAAEQFLSALEAAIEAARESH